MSYPPVEGYSMEASAPARAMPAEPMMMPAGYQPPRPGVPPVYPEGIPRGVPKKDAVGEDMKIKAKWDVKREMKLQGAYQQIVADGTITPNEIVSVLRTQGYVLTPEEALQFLFEIDVNKDGVISWEEFRDGVRMLVTFFPKDKAAKKADKKAYKAEKKADKKAAKADKKAAKYQAKYGVTPTVPK